MHNVSIVMKRNMASATIGMCSLMMRSDIFHPHHNTPEASDNNFGFFRSMKREFNIIDCVEVDDKIVHKRSAMYESDLKCYRSRNKGHQAMLSDFFRQPTTALVE